MIVLYYQIKTLIGFWCKRELNHKSLIQPSEILSVEVTEIHVLLITLSYNKLQITVYFIFWDNLNYAA